MVVEPGFPARLEAILQLLREAPESNSVVLREKLVTSVRGNGHHAAGLRKMMRSRKSPFEDGGTSRRQLLAGVPPPSEIHLAAACDGDAELEQPIVVQLSFLIGESHGGQGFSRKANKLHCIKQLFR